MGAPARQRGRFRWPHATAFGVPRAPPEELMCFPVLSMDHGQITFGAGRCILSLDGCRRHRWARCSLCRAHHQKQRFPMNQFNRLARGKPRGITGVAAQRYNFDLVGPVVHQQAIHLPHHIDAHLPCSPLLALNKCSLAVLSQDKIDSTIFAAKARLLDGITLASKCFADQQLEFLPIETPDAVQPTLRFEQ